MISDINSTHIEACVISSSEDWDDYNWKSFIVPKCMTLTELKLFLLSNLGLIGDFDLKIMIEFEPGSYGFRFLSDNDYITLDKVGIQNNSKLCLEMKKGLNYTNICLDEYIDEVAIDNPIDVLSRSHSDSTEILSSSTETYSEQDEFFFTMPEQREFIATQEVKEVSQSREDLTELIEKINKAFIDKNKVKLQIKPIASLKKSINRISEELNELKKMK
ncbi:unnamed protein product [Blepharisma stoltei]|uniref:Uncharacterized protein n=1 Tax=Blepharisma stoltei TaxID=1481888 RepID=A0AAU9JV35_9CILI|nr:unnamed protein product [Blepharisma stoltei]